MVRARHCARCPFALLGLRGGWLDAKGAPYELQNPVAVEEPAKDVAAFADVGSGGLLVLGVATRLEDGVEVLDRIVSVDRAAFVLDRLRKLVRQRITPAPLGVMVDCSKDANGAVVFIDVPRSRPSASPTSARPRGPRAAGSTRTPRRRRCARPTRRTGCPGWTSSGCWPPCPPVHRPG